MVYDEADCLQLSGLQHFVFCRRQWALIHLEQQWTENLRTMDGRIVHQRAHDAAQRERRGETIITRDLRIFSHDLGLSGACDVVEFRRSETGVPLAGVEGCYQPYPVEYKKGRPRCDHANEVQLCAQAMCLEEMLCCTIPEGALYFSETRQRVPVALTQALRDEVTTAAAEMHQLAQRRHTPKVKRTKACNACSLKELCLPALMKKPSVNAYYQARLEGDE